MLKKIVENPHFQTILSSVILSAPNIKYKRETIKTKDNDFLDLDWVKSGNPHLIIISHGLEGSSKSPYIRRFIDHFLSSEFDFLAWNFRSCSGRMNNLQRFYHAGETEDLHQVIEFAGKFYKKIFLLGFSLGGNVSLVYGCRSPSKKVNAIVAVSAPVDLKSSAEQFQHHSKKVYMKIFTSSLLPKINQKIKNKSLDWIQDFHDFDEYITAPLHGFKDANHYWKKSSFITNAELLSKDSLLINAIDDPFLGPGCYPKEKISNYLTTFYPEKGGHLSFLKANYFTFCPGHYFMNWAIDFFRKKV